jgi:hypothetical protein
LKKEQEKEKKKAVTSSISSILKAKERSTKKQPVVKTDSDEDDEMEVSTKGKRTFITNVRFYFYLLMSDLFGVILDIIADKQYCQAKFSQAFMQHNTVVID